MALMLFCVAAQMLARWRQRRQVERSASKAWPSHRIPFEVSAEFGECFYPLFICKTLVNTSLHAHILAGMRLIEAKTCIRFVPRQPGQPFVRFVPMPELGCQSYVGRLAETDAQPVMLVEGCEAPEVAHELLHSLGVWHEHGRADRDQFVFVDPAAVPEASSDHVFEHFVSSRIIRRSASEFFCCS